MRHIRITIFITKSRFDKATRFTDATCDRIVVAHPKYLGLSRANKYVYIWEHWSASQPFV